MRLKRFVSKILSIVLLLSTITIGVLVTANTELSTPTVIYDFEEGQNLSYSGMQYTTEETENGTNRYMTYYTETGTGYPTLGFKTDFVLSKNKEYIVTLKYKLDMKSTSTGKSTVYFNRKLRPVLGNLAENSYFYQCGKNYSMDDANLYTPGINDGITLVNTNEWKEITINFDTTDSADKIDDNAKYLGFVMQFNPDKTVNICIDDIAIYDVDNTTSEEVNTHARLINDETLGWNMLYVAKDGTNIITDYSFEDGNGNWRNLTNTDALGITDEKAHDGNKSLKFSANGLTEDVWSYAYFNVEPNTDYYLSTWVLGENWSETNKNDMYFGIADCESGYFITYDTNIEEETVKTANEQLTCAAWDGEWHLVNVKFNTGLAEIIAFAIRGKESVAYFDQIAIFKDSDKERYKAYHQTLSDISLYEEEVGDMFDCKVGTNTIENSDLSDNSSDYWQTGTNFGISDDGEMHYQGNFVEIADTASTKGKALHYKANTSVTGVPLQTYYMKWIGVEPWTDYTFSADVLVLEKGEGGIVIVDNNPFFPNTVKSMYFGEENYNEDKKWQKFNFKFNTGDYSEIGFFVFDGGGEAYIDNIRLFKTADAIKGTETSYPTEITSNTYTVSDGVISNIAPDTTIADALSKIDGESFLKVYRNGIEITDKKQYIRTGMEIRYMDGVSFYAKATASVLNDSGDICVSGINLVANGGLENGKTNWGAIYNGMGTIADSYLTSTDVHSGNCAAVITGANGNYPYISTKFSAKPNTDYVITFWIKSTCNIQFRLSNGITAFPTSWNSLTAISGFGDNDHVINGTKSVWTKKSYSFNSGDITSDNIGIVFRRGASNGTVYIDDVKVFETAAHEFEDGHCVSCKVMEYDYTADGICDIRDLIRLKKYLANLEIEIADFHDDGICENTDLVKVRKRLLKVG